MGNGKGHDRGRGKGKGKGKTSSSHDELATEPCPGKTTEVDTPRTLDTDDLDLVEAMIDYGDAVGHVYTNAHAAFGEEFAALLAAPAEHDGPNVVLIDMFCNIIGDAIGMRWEKSVGSLKDSANRMRETADLTALESATGIPVGAGLEKRFDRFKPDMIRQGVRSSSRMIRSTLVHPKKVSDNTNHRDAAYLQSLRDGLGPTFTWLRRDMPKKMGWTAAEYRAAAKELTGPDHSVEAYRQIVQSELAGYRASGIDRIGPNRTMYGQTTIHLTIVSRADTQMKWALIEYFHPNPSQPTKLYQDQLVPWTQRQFVTWVEDKRSGTALAYQRNRNRDATWAQDDYGGVSQVNPNGIPMLIDTFDPATGMAEVDEWRAQANMGRTLEITASAGAAGSAR